MVNDFARLFIRLQNFLAFHSSKKVPNVIEFEQKMLRVWEFIVPIVGESLIELDLKSLY